MNFDFEISRADCILALDSKLIALKEQLIRMDVCYAILRPFQQYFTHIRTMDG